MRGDCGINHGGIHADDIKARLQEPLAGSTGRSTEFNRPLTALERDTKRRDRFVELQPGPRDLVGRERMRINASRPAARRRCRAVPPNPSAVGGVEHAVEHEVVGRRHRVIVHRDATRRRDRRADIGSHDVEPLVALPDMDRIP